jgi:hypothetical protein
MNMDDIIVIDDFLAIDQQESIKNILHGRLFPWYYNDTHVEEYEDKNNPQAYSDAKCEGVEGYSNSGQFTHVFVHDERIDSNAADDVFLPLATGLSQVFPEQNKNIIRAKTNLVLKQPSDVFDYGVPHVDTAMRKHFSDVWVGLYYVNDSDGDTLIFKEKGSWFSGDQLTLKQSVEPKQGRLVVFNNDHVHASGLPKSHDTRVVINFHFEVV